MGGNADMTSYRETSEILKLDHILSSLNDSDIICLVHHTDPDGVCSGALLAKSINQIRKRPIDLRLNQQSNEIELTSATVNSLKRAGADIIFITDMASDQNPAPLLELAKTSRVILIDHHPRLNSFSDKNITVIKAQEISSLPPPHYCTSKLVYDLFGRHTDLSLWDWICCIGIISDRSQKTWKEFLEQTFLKHKIPQTADYTHSPLGILANMISQTEAYSTNKTGEVFDAIMNSAQYTDLSDSAIKKYSSIVNKEISDQLDHHTKWCTINQNKEYLIGEVSSPYHIKSNITTLLGERYPHLTIIIYQKHSDDRYTLSIRRMDGSVQVNTAIIQST